MKEKTVIYICILNGILMLINPIIGILLFVEGSSSFIIIATYASLYSGFSLIIGALLFREDYTPIGVDFLELGTNLLKISLIVDIIGLVIFDILLITQLKTPNVPSIIYIIFFNIVEIVTIIITFLIIKKFKFALETHDHGEEFSH